MKFKTMHDGAEIEVEIDAIPMDEVKSTYVPKQLLEQETAKYKRLLDGRPAKDDLLKDEEFRKAALTTWGVDPSGQAKLSPEQINEIRAGVIKSEVEPLRAKLAENEGLVGTVLGRDLENQIRAAVAKKVQPEFAPLIVPMLKARHTFGFDMDRQTHAVKKADGSFEVSPRPTDAKLYKDAEDVVEEWARTDEAKRFLIDQRQRVGGDGKPDTSGGSSGTKTVDLQGGGPLVIKNKQSLEDIASGKTVIRLPEE